MATSVQVILLARVAWAVANDADMAENVRIASMRTRKSQVDIEIYCGGGAVVLGPATFAGAVVLGAEGSRGAKDAGVVGNGAVEAGARTEDAGT